MHVRASAHALFLRRDQPNEAPNPKSGAQSLPSEAGLGSSADLNLCRSSPGLLLKAGEQKRRRK